MKNWICYLSLLFLVACDKGDDLPAWDKSITFDQIERYETLRQRIDEKALLSTLTSSVFEALVLNEHRDGEWVYADELLTGKSYAQQFLFESDSRCIEGINLDYPPFYRAVAYEWSYDSGRKTIVLTDESGAIHSELYVVWLSADRMILRRSYREPIEAWQSAAEHSTDMQYLVGDFGSMTREEFRARYEASAE